MRNSVQVVWQRGPVRGKIEVFHGRLASARIAKGQGRVNGPSFAISSSGEVRLLLKLSGARVAEGARAARVTVRTWEHPFTFFLRDVSRDFPIFIPEYGVAVVPAADSRTFSEVAEAVRSRGAVSEMERLEAEPEETYENACRANRDQVCPTWLGLGRDMRLFRVGYSPEYGYWGYIEPCYHSKRPFIHKPCVPPPLPNRPHTIGFCIGRGSSCRVKIVRRLDEGVLPILTSVQEDGDVSYRLIAFATLEKRPLGPGRVRGSEWRAAYANTGGHMCKEDELRSLNALIAGEMYGREEEPVCCLRVTATNSGAVPRYAWFKAPAGQWQTRPASAAYRGAAGFSVADGDVYAISRMNGRPMPQPEMAVLLPPGGSATLDLLVPHQPLSEKRARALARMDVERHLDACRRFWRAKLATAAQVSVPEPAIDERIRAGLLHCDLVALGREPGGNVLATVGWYAPIGSESSPIIQFFDAMGWHKLAERSIQFFLDRQNPDGFMQNFAGYQLETGAVLWTMGEHYRYTRDRKWVARVTPNILKACNYLLAWRERNRREDLRGKGYGLQDGKVADPEDYFHAFMLNALSYIGLQRSAEMLAGMDPGKARRLATEARAYREDIRTAFREAMANSPVIPTGNGTWAPTAPPWTEHPGPLALYAEGGEWWTHGAFGARDSLIGALYLGIGEILDPGETETDFLLRSHQELFTLRNAGLSQPYYCRHDYLHLARGEVKPFLKTYYNQFTALQDRQTYTFWEHYFGVSQHKTHEEGWFLMQTRWMLAMEEGSTLHLLRAIPRAWLIQGKRISIENLGTHFGRVSLHVESRVADGEIEAHYEFHENRRPERLVLRLPHPKAVRARSVVGGVYDPRTESAGVRHPRKDGTVIVRF